jgi:ribosome maturation factor RimP
LIEKIERIIVDPLEKKGYELIQINTIFGATTVVDISIDRSDGKHVSVDDCVTASRIVSAILDVEDIVHGKYNLNISSPGEYRKILSQDEFRRFCGHEVKLELLSPVNGKKKVTGDLEKIEQSSTGMIVYLKEKCNTVSALIGVAYENIKKASVKRLFKM